MELLGAPEVFLDGEQKAPVGGELGELALGDLVQAAVPCELLQEGRQRSVRRHRTHAQEDAPRLRILSNGLEGLDVVQPVVDHTRRTSLSSAWIRLYSDEADDAGDAHLRRQFRLGRQAADRAVE